MGNRGGHKRNERRRVRGGGSECERRSSYSTAQRVLDVEVEALKSKLKSLKS